LRRTADPSAHPPWIDLEHRLCTKNAVSAMKEDYMNRTTLLLLGGILSLGLVSACGGSSTADLMLFDAPPPGVSAVKIWVASMQVHVADKDDKKDGDPRDSTIDDDGHWESLTVDRPIDLVQHQGESAAELLGQLSLPEGKITQIRLVIDTSKPNVAVVNGTSCDLDTSGIARTGVKIIHPFKAFQTKKSSHHQIFVDFRLDESMQAEGTCFRLLPVIRLERVKTDNVDIDIRIEVSINGKDPSKP
jgi:uncharacterized protein DUF4382